MELFSAEFFSALFAIIIIDLSLAGDNAIVIALAARDLPANLQRRAIVWGTFGAIAVRVVMTMAVVWRRSRSMYCSRMPREPEVSSTASRMTSAPHSTQATPPLTSNLNPSSRMGTKGESDQRYL